MGSVGGYPIPEVNLLINAFRMGVSEVNADASFLNGFIGAWFDPARAQEAAIAQIDAGADILFGERIGTADGAQARGVKAIGSLIDYTPRYPDTVFANAIWNYGPTIAAVVADLQMGHPVGRDYTAYSFMAHGGNELIYVPDMVPAGRHSGHGVKKDVNRIGRFRGPDQFQRTGLTSFAHVADATALAGAIATGLVNPQAVVQAVYKATRDRADLGAVVTMLPRREAMRAVEEGAATDGPFAAVPMLAKDIGAPVADLRQGLGSDAVRARLSAPNRETEGRLIRAFRAGGLVPIGLSTVPELGFALSCEPPKGPVARNPFDRNRTPGGSSAGQQRRWPAESFPLPTPRMRRGPSVCRRQHAGSGG